MFKIKKPSTVKNVEQRYVSHTLNEILPYLPNEDCFFDTRHWTCDTTDGILPFAVTTDISRNAQQFLKEMRQVLPLNADEQGLCRPLKAQYYKNGRANFLKSDGGSFAATGVIEYMNETKYIGQMSSSQNSRVIDPSGISYAVTNEEKDGMPKILQNAHGFNKGGEHIISPTITGSKFQDNNVVCEPLRIRQATKQGYIEVEQGGGFDATYPESTTRRGRVQEGGHIAPTLMASGDAPCRYEGVKEPSYRIRKLTPRECFRLMGVEDQDIDKIQQSGVSHTQQYKMAGNSIVVDCLYHIFRKLLAEQQSEGRQLTLF